MHNIDDGEELAMGNGSLRQVASDEGTRDSRNREASTQPGGAERPGPDPNPPQDGRRGLPEYLDVMFVEAYPVQP